MKKKSLILTTAFAMALGVGVAVGAHQSKAGVKEAEAVGEITLYCKMEQSWWKADGAAVGAHYWGGTGATEWPGERMTAVVGETDLWSITIPSNNTGIIFTRVNGSGAIDDWGAKTKDQTIPTDGKNLFTITSSSPVWGEPGCEGTWSVYESEEPEPVEPGDTSFYLVGTFNDWTKSDDYEFVVDSEDNNHYVLEDVELAAGAEMKAYKPDGNVWLGVAEAYEGCGWTVGVGEDHDGNCIITNAGTYTVNLYVNSENGNHLTIENEVEPEPADTNYYLLGTFNDWEKSDDYKFAVDSEDNNHYFLEHVDITAKDEMKAHKPDGNVWLGVAEAYEGCGWTVGVAEGHEGNCIVTNTSTYTVNLYVNSENGNHLTIADEVEPEPDVPAENGYYVVGSESSWTYQGATKLGEGDEENYAVLLQYEAKEGESFKVKSYFDGVETWFAINGDPSDAGNYVSDSAKKVNIYASKDGNLYVSDYDPDIPAENGYYVVGSESEWQFAGATKLGEGDELNYAILLGYDAKKDESFKVRSYIDGVKTWFAINGDPSDAGNYVASEDKKVDIYASKDGQLYVYDHAEPVQAPKYYYSLNGAADVEMTPNGETEVMSASLSFKAGDELTFKVSESPYEEKTTYAAEPKEDVQYTNVELVENKLVFAQDYSGSLYLNIEGETGKLWAGHLEGYYLVGTHCEWNVKHGIKAPEKAGEAGTYVLAGVELAANAEVKFYHFGDAVYEDPSQGYIAIDPEKLHIAEGISAELTEKDGNLKFNAAGCFDIYLNTNDGNYLSVENNGYTPADLEDFLTKFDNDLSAVCNTLGSDDYLIKLKGEWSRQSSAFKLLSAADQKTIHDAGFDYEGEGKLGTMIAKYRYIVNKYGTAEFNDFIWNQDVVVVGNSMPELSRDSNVMLIVIITISAVSVASLGALLILKKKKRK